MPMQQILIDQIVQRVGIPADKAQAAVEVVVGYLKERLPGPASALLDNAVSGEAAKSGVLGQAAQQLGGLFIKN
jgi:hypothetical protein